MKRIGLGFAAILTGLSAATYLGLHPTFGGEETDPKPPVARVVPKTFEEYGKRRVDDYYWLRESENPEVIACLEAENLYADARLARLKPLSDEIYAEMKPRAVDAVLDLRRELGALREEVGALREAVAPKTARRGFW